MKTSAEGSSQSEEEEEETDEDEDEEEGEGGEGGLSDEEPPGGSLPRLAGAEAAQAPPSKPQEPCPAYRCKAGSRSSQRGLPLIDPEEEEEEAALPEDWEAERSRRRKRRKYRPAPTPPPRHAPHAASQGHLSPPPPGPWEGCPEACRSSPPLAPCSWPLAALCSH